MCWNRCLNGNGERMKVFKKGLCKECFKAISSHNKSVEGYKPLQLKRGNE